MMIGALPAIWPRDADSTAFDYFRVSRWIVGGILLVVMLHFLANKKNLNP
ncbi:MAG: hypothetical protein H6765_07580 [Candidatus Peribacteria bacterium]|nr:MAG: hypothetical protein H6765_07580 [Candidatus Peribacteria bacterium]